jgi:hypothetical protein
MQLCISVVSNHPEPGSDPTKLLPLKECLIQNMRPLYRRRSVIDPSHMLLARCPIVTKLRKLLSAIF